MPRARLTVDEEDRDAVRFWSGLVEALESLAPGRGMAALTLMTRPNSLMEGVAVLLDELERAPTAPSCW